MLITLLISFVIIAPLIGYYSTTLAQAIIEKAQLNHSFAADCQIGLIYFSIAMILTVLNAILEDFYCRWKTAKIEG